MIDLVLAGRDALRVAERDGVTGRLKRIRSGLAVILPEITLGLYPDHIRLLHKGSGTGVATILPQLCKRLEFASPGAGAPPSHAVLAGTAAYLDRLERNAEAARSEPLPDSMPDGPDDAGLSF